MANFRISNNRGSWITEGENVHDALAKWAALHPDEAQHTIQIQEHKAEEESPKADSPRERARKAVSANTKKYEFEEGKPNAIWIIGPWAAADITLAAVYDRAEWKALMAEVLVAHQRTSPQYCRCGWGDLGKSHADHKADAILDAFEKFLEVGSPVENEHTGIRSFSVGPDDTLVVTAELEPFKHWGTYTSTDGGKTWTRKE